MSNWKYTDTTNKIVWRGQDSCLVEAIADWLAAGNTPEPADLPDPKVAIQAQIDSLERQQLMPRATREFMLLAMEAQAPADVLANNPGYVAVKAFDRQIAALRALL